MRKAWFVLMLVSGLACADPLRNNVASFDAVASRVVANDTAYATLFAEVTETDPSRLAERINPLLVFGVKAAKQGGAMQSVSTGYSTFPLYNSKSNKQEGWRGRGELRLTSRDFTALSLLIGELQKPQAGLSLQLAEIHYGVSDEARKKAETELIEEGLQVFRARAALIQKGMGSKSWKLINVTIATRSDLAETGVVFQMAAPMLAKVAPASAPVESGDSRLNVTIQGSIELE